MNVNFTRNYFELFGLSERYSIDQHRLTERYRTLQSEWHPDQYINTSDQERRVSVQMAAHINEAYATLKDDLKRAQYLLGLNDIEFNAETETSNDVEFLKQTMQLHEQLEDASAAQAPLQFLSDFSRQLKQSQEELTVKISVQFEKNNFKAAKDTASKLQFYQRLLNQVREKQEHFEEQLL